jgi:AraC-like DNA-binding protein
LHDPLNRGAFVQAPLAPPPRRGLNAPMEPLAELRRLIARHAGPDGEVATPLPGLRLVSSSAPTLPIHHVYEPALALVAQGAKRAMLGERVFDYGAGQYLVVSVELPIASHVCRASAREPFLAMAMTLRPAAIAALLLDMAAGDHRAGLGGAGMAVCEAAPELLETAVRLLRLLDRPQDLGVMAPLIEREMLWRLLNGEQGALVRQIGLADSRIAQVGQAIRWIRAHYAETLRIEHLAKLAAMSVSSFHRHFRAVTLMSPIQYQKQVRLQAARERLLREPGDVAAVGYGVGYDSPSQFSREYKRVFGEAPGRDVGRLRGGGLVAGE